MPFGSPATMDALAWTAPELARCHRFRPTMWNTRDLYKEAVRFHRHDDIGYSIPPLPATAAAAAAYTCSGVSLGALRAFRRDEIPLQLNFPIESILSLTS